MEGFVFAIGVTALFGGALFGVLGLFLWVEIEHRRALRWALRDGRKRKRPATGLG